ncbi:OmpA family protein [Salinicoccus sp. Marseille-QA3877]
MKRYSTLLFSLLFTLAACGGNDDSQGSADEESADTDTGTVEVTDGDNSEETSGSPEESPEKESEEADENLGEDSENQEDDNEMDEEDEEPVVYTENFEREGYETGVEITVHPIRTEDGLAVLDMDFKRTDDGEGGLRLEEMLSHPATERTSHRAVTRGDQFDRLGYNVRLFDNINKEVYHTLFYQENRDDDGTTYMATNALKGEEIDSTAFNDGETVSYQAVFNAPEEDLVNLLIESFDVITEIPVVESQGVRDMAEDLLNENVSDVAGLTVDDVPEQIYSLQTYDENIESNVGTLVEEDAASITLDSTVLFEADSVELRDGGDTAIADAAKELERAPGGELLIVGHTDNTETKEYSQTLSEDRAEAIYSHLDEAMDLSVFDGVVTEGRNFAEPVASNDTEESQALNRRVELYFEPPEESSEETVEVELPDNLGPVEDYEDNNHIEVLYSNNHTFEVSADSLQRYDDYIVGRFNVTKIDGSSTHIHNPVNSGFGHGARNLNVDDNAETSGGLLDNYDADGITLIDGDRRVFPIDYWALTVNDSRSEGDEELVPLANRNVRVGSRLEDGESVTVTVIYPDIAADTVTVDHAPTDNYDENIDERLDYLVPWRLLNVPIEDADYDNE